MTEYLHGYIKRSGFLHGIGLLGLIVLGLGVLGWFLSINVARIEVHGAVDAGEPEILALADLQIGQKIYKTNASELGGRVEKHPWVQTASISRFPNGTLRINIRERKPELLVLDKNGRPIVYLDKSGRHMPFRDTSFHDVPIFHGYDVNEASDGHVKNVVVQELLLALADNITETDDLISEVSLKSDQIGLRLEPAGNHGAIPVQLGSTEFIKKLKRLRAFWYQNMVPAQNTRYESLDLRYASQIVSRENTP